MKKLVMILGIIGIIVVALIGVVMKLGEAQKNDMKALRYEVIDMSKVENGDYEGIAETTLVKVTVMVTVFDHQITDIVINRHDNGKGQPAEIIVQNMIEQNNWEVDGVSGATTSSNVIKSAVSNALSKGIK
ncbi:FMN-binding protein [Candidatus Galacturonibacter soehngenii]|uniref:FMN-binding protein n=1 Tax=Candidatus Galacturonatibacter soehngenii TaxID=2307010 RepID=A0A7V7QJ52_9FIRM|nr:FMN-binding protein [Candidatus Galacturonibacter soehngenii]KAB1437451.1 FMN-binding protein [Candidatus Galacturonibacter soehngenii]